MNYANITIITLGLISSPANAAPIEKSKPVELGQVSWLRSFDTACKTAQKQNRPVLVLFQEVPGCHTCVTYGQNVLSHPLIVDAAHNYFVPVAVYNNLKGTDETVLKSFNEPSWNNPVVRIIRHDRSSLATRVNKDYTVAGIASAMTESLSAFGTKAPKWLALLAQEESSRKTGIEKATFVMHCFWEGEGKLATTEGVVSTLPGFIGKDEVVEVEYDPRKIDFKSLLTKARAAECAQKVYARTDSQQAIASAIIGNESKRTDEAIRLDKEPKYYLAQTEYRFVPMTAMQSALVNATIGAKKDPKHLLAPSQLRLHDRISRHPNAGWKNAIGKDILKAWAEVTVIDSKIGK